MHLVYTGTVFQLLGEGGEYGTAEAPQVLEGYTVGLENGVIEGTMPNRGAITSTLNAGNSYTIPEGYHNGSGKVTANSLASQTAADATAANILSGKTAWVNGQKITGTIPSKAAATITPGTTNQTIPANQFLGGVQTILGDPDLIAANIVKGKQIFGVNGNAKEVSVVAGDVSILQVGSGVTDMGISGSLSPRIFENSQFRINTNGSIRIGFKFRTRNQAYTAYAQIYKNGSPIGILRTTNDASYIGQVLYSQDFTCNEGDIFSIYGWVDNSNNTSYMTYLNVGVVQAFTLIDKLN